MRDELELLMYLHLYHRISILIVVSEVASREARLRPLLSDGGLWP